MILKGPELQERLYGTPAAYESSDIDVLIHPRDARRARVVMLRTGWTFEPDNGVMWRLSAAASFEREGFRADLHWGLHAAHLPAWTLRPPERALWERARLAPSGFYEPDAESLFVFLAIHAVGHGFERPEWVENVHAAAALVCDWSRVWSIARAARVTHAVRAAMAEQAPGRRVPVLDGPAGRAAWWATYAIRGHAFPQGIRDRIREARAMQRDGFGLVALRGGKLVRVGDLPLIVEPGVFDPKSVTLEGMEIAEREFGDEGPSVIVDVGTGSGLVAIAAARRWPGARVYGTDISTRAVSCARRNAKRLGARAVRVHAGSLMRPMPPSLHGRVELVFSNVPYVSPAGGRSDGWEVPLTTVYGPDADGLGFMRELCRELPRFLGVGGLWVFQLGDSQLEPWSAHLATHGFEPVPAVSRRPGHAIVAAARWKGDHR